MSEHTVRLLPCMRILPARQPVVVIERLEEHPEWREIVVSAYVQTKELYHLILRICMGQRTKCFLGTLCYLSFYVVSSFKDDSSYA